MLSGAQDLIGVTSEVYEDPENLPKSFKVLSASLQVREGADAKLLAKEAGTTSSRLRLLADSEDPVTDVFKTSLPVTPESLTRARSIVGQLLLGVLAERAFEVIYKAELGTDDLRLEDQREGYTETDYRVLNGSDRPVFRLNIKFHGTLFKQAQAMVGLDPEDCFALATYKINQAVLRERQEVLPYIFAIVSVPGLAAESAAAIVPSDLLELAAFAKASKMPRKRSLEDAIVRFVTGPRAEAETRVAVGVFIDRIRQAKWRLISATRADRLLRELLFDRVFAVRVRTFNRSYRNAEVDMHFSLDQDLTPLGTFLTLVKERGLHGATAYLIAGRA